MDNNATKKKIEQDKHLASVLALQHLQQQNAFTQQMLQEINQHKDMKTLNKQLAHSYNQLNQLSGIPGQQYTTFPKPSGNIEKIESEEEVIKNMKDSLDLLYNDEKFTLFKAQENVYAAFHLHERHSTAYACVYVPKDQVIACDFCGEQAPEGLEFLVSSGILESDTKAKKGIGDVMPRREYSRNDIVVDTPPLITPRDNTLEALEVSTEHLVERAKYVVTAFEVSIKKPRSLTAQVLAAISQYLAENFRYTASMG